MTSYFSHLYKKQSGYERYICALESIYQRIAPKHCFIASFDNENNTSHSLYHLKDGEVSDNFSYPLENTPCDVARASNKICFLEIDLQKQFPEDEVLVQWNVDGYLAATLYSPTNTPVGILVCLFENNPNLNDEDKNWFKELSNIIATEFNYQLKIEQQQHLLSRLNIGESISNIGTLQWELDTDKFKFSEQLYRIFSCAKVENLNLAQVMSVLNFQENIQLESKLNKIQQKKITHLDLVLSRKVNGQLQYIQLNGQLKSGQNKHGDIFFATLRDISKEKIIHKEQELSEVVFNNTTEAIMITDKNNCIIKVNPALESLTGYRQKELLGLTPSVFSSGKHDQKYYDDLWSHLEIKGYWKGEIYNKRKNGETFLEEIVINVVHNDNQDVSHYVAIFRDITQWKLTEKRLTFFANNDTLTGLINRRSFSQVLLEKTQSEQSNPFAVLYLDINRFKEINDLYGHEVADLLLCEVAQRLNKAADNNDVVCRHSGDQFTVLINNLSCIAIEEKAQEIHDLLVSPYIFNDIIIEIILRIGIAQYPESGTNSFELLRNSNHAMSSLKLKQRTGIAVHDKEIHQNYLRKINLRNDLKEAIKNNSLKVYYQPILASNSKKVIKLEALVRWFHPKLGFVSPVEFIPIAEEFGLIHKLGLFVAQQACRDLKHLKSLGHDISVSINRSLNEFRHDVDQKLEFLQLLNKFNLSASDITIEVTESVALSSNLNANETLDSLHDLGFKIALDDFCTGYSSLSNLIDCKADYLKIDKSFVQSIETEKNHRAVVASLITLANQLDIQVIAEGVETQAQADLLTKLGSNLLQGYLFNPALPIKECEQYISSQNGV